MPTKNGTYTLLLLGWLSVDPLADKYPSLSPYAYCANNPVMLVDPDGRDIEPGSLKEWNNNKNNTMKGKNKSANIKNPTADQMDRLNSLRNTLTTMDDLENSSQMYAVKNVGGDKGNVTLENGDVISINYTDRTANFVHEVTHARQFECGNEGFNTETGKPMTQDIFDEVAAYKAQYAYSPSSVYNLTSTESVKGRFSYAKITNKWVRGIMDNNGRQVYSYDNKIGLSPINVYNTINDINISRERESIGNLGNTPLYTIPTTYYKNKK